MLLDTILLGLPIAGGALRVFAQKFTQNLDSAARKLPILTRNGSHTMVLPGVGVVRKIDDLMDEAFNTARNLNSGDSQTLARRIEAINDLPARSLVGRNVQAHHVIPKEFAGTGRHHRLLDELSFNIDSALNGIPLNNTYHMGSHNMYSDAWKMALDRIHAYRGPISQKQELLVEAIANANTAIINSPGLHSNSYTPVSKWFDDILPVSLR